MRRPSGDQDGQASLLIVNLRRFEPSASTMWMPGSLPVPHELKASFVPSGDHAGPKSPHEPFVSCFSPEPSGRTTQIAYRGISRPKASVEPSGDQEGRVWTD